MSEISNSNTAREAPRRQDEKKRTPVECKQSPTGRPKGQGQVSSGQEQGGPYRMSNIKNSNRRIERESPRRLGGKQRAGVEGKNSPRERRQGQDQVSSGQDRGEPYRMSNSNNSNIQRESSRRQGEKQRVAVEGITSPTEEGRVGSNQERDKPMSTLNNSNIEREAKSNEEQPAAGGRSKAPTEHPGGQDRVDPGQELGEPKRTPRTNDSNTEREARSDEEQPAADGRSKPPTEHPRGQGQVDSGQLRDEPRSAPSDSYIEREASSNDERPTADECSKPPTEHPGGQDRVDPVQELDKLKRTSKINDSNIECEVTIRQNEEQSTAVEGSNPPTGHPAGQVQVGLGQKRDEPKGPVIASNAELETHRRQNEEQSIAVEGGNPPTENPGAQDRVDSCPERGELNRRTINDSNVQRETHRRQNKEQPNAAESSDLPTGHPEGQHRADSGHERLEADSEIATPGADVSQEEFTALASRVGRVESSIESLQVILAAVLSKVDDLEEESQLVEMFVDDVVQSVKPDTGFDA
ncbi:hypothetical protein BaRGS_00030559 [Batillaria attramentaria]|uniref:Uncharacterized protein n=1 Tax=Batillaria attramentaria TaxID=370345 RepID=A0ABD0JUJ3_9CAEN